jgi:hypothetical protein
MQEIKDYINIEENNFLSLFVEPKINIKSTYITDNEKLYLKKITNENRKQEFLQIRALRNKSIGEIEIDYTRRLSLTISQIDSDFVSHLLITPPFPCVNEF